jgi:hypothetical protein
MRPGRIRRGGTIAVLLAALVGLSPACDKGGGGESRRAPETPAELGEAIGNVYIDALLELKALVEPRPPAEQLAPQVDALHERYVQVLVPLGHQREALSASDRGTVDSALTSVLWGGRTESELGGLQWLTDAVNHYRPMSNDLANRISDFNVITQYASFELLRRQKPAEVERLGLGPAPAEGAGP